MKSAVEKLNTTSAALGQAMYAAAQAEQPEGGEPTAETPEGEATETASDDDVVDAEIVDETDESSTSGESK